MSLDRWFHKLPFLEDEWEIGLLPSPMSADGALLLLVVEAQSGRIRSAVVTFPDEDVTRRLHQAFFEPGPHCRPGRPRVARFPDPGLLTRLAPKFLAIGAQCEVAVQTPALDEAVQALADHMRPASTPGFDRDHPQWRVALGEFLRAEPWKLPSGIEFTFRGAGLDAAICFVVGEDGRDPGVVMLRRRADFDEVVRQTSGDHDRPVEVPFVMLRLSRANQLSTEEIEACRAADLELDGWFPRACAYEGARRRALSEREQQRLLDAIGGIAALCAREFDRVAAFESCSATLVGARGELVVTGAVPLDDLVDADCRYSAGVIAIDGSEPLPALVLKLRKRDAKRIAGRLVGVSAVEIRGDVRNGLEIIAVGSARPFGRLARVPAGPDASTLLDDLVADRIRLVVAAGGPRRDGLKAGDVVFTQVVDRLTP